MCTGKTEKFPSCNCSILTSPCGMGKPQVQPKCSSSPHLPTELGQDSNPKAEGLSPAVIPLLSMVLQLPEATETPGVREAGTALPSTSQSRRVCGKGSSRASGSRAADTNRPGDAVAPFSLTETSVCCPEALPPSFSLQLLHSLGMRGAQK